MQQENLSHLYTASFHTNWECPLYTDYQSNGAYTYSDVAKKITSLQITFELYGIQRGDKIALFGRNSSHWAITFMAALSYGAVVVPILPDFHSEDVHHIINHSESTTLFVADLLWNKLSHSEMSNLKNCFSLESFEPISTTDKQPNEEAKKTFETKFPNLFSKNDFILRCVENDELAVINYTSGTTGFSKGVMLSGGSLVKNIQYAIDKIPMQPNDKLVSFLPMAHAFGCLSDFLLPTALGCYVSYINKTPSPQLLLDAFQEVKPGMVFTVPLIMDKIYKKKILPILEKPSVKLLTKIPFVKNIIYNKIKASLIESFGGRIVELVIGGAALNSDAEELLTTIKFPFAIGYGMTECGPLISYESHKTKRLGSAGTILTDMQLQIDSAEPYSTPGEIMVKAENVMMGYYKNEKATAESIDADGWLHTGDLGITDNKSFIYIKGRSKTMLLGPSGQNIYPEELESRLNNMPYIAESLILDDSNHKLVALIHTDIEAVKKDKISDEALTKLLEENRKLINKQVSAYQNITRFVIHQTEFKKTPKKSIKRFLYSID